MKFMVATVVTCLALTGCSLLPGGKGARANNVYLLESVPVARRSEPVGCHNVVVNAPEPAPGFGGAQMFYQRSPNLVERFAYSRWAENPGRMLAPVLINGLKSSGAFANVIASPAPVSADIRVEADGLRLLQRFEGDRSRIELSLDVRVIAPLERRLLGTTQLSYSEAAPAASPQAGVTAAQRAVTRLVEDYVAFVIESAASVVPDCAQP